MEESKYDSVNEDEYSEWHPRHSEQPQQVDTVFVTGRSKTRGRPRIPWRWTRVINVDTMTGEQARIWPTATDILVAEGLPAVPPRRREPEWQPIFWPKAFEKEHHDLTLENYRIGEKRML
jgi:hypothetical protein